MKSEIQKIIDGLTELSGWAEEVDADYAADHKTLADHQKVLAFHAQDIVEIKVRLKALEDEATATPEPEPAPEPGPTVLFDQNSDRGHATLLLLAGSDTKWSLSGTALIGTHVVGTHLPKDLFIMFPAPVSEVVAEWDQTFDATFLNDKQKGLGPSNNNDAVPHFSFKTELGGWQATGKAGNPGQAGVDSYDKNTTGYGDEIKNPKVVVTPGKHHFREEVGPNYGRLYVDETLVIDAPRDFGNNAFDRFCVGAYVGGDWTANKGGSTVIENLVIAGR